ALCAVGCRSIDCNNMASGLLRGATARIAASDRDLMPGARRIVAEYRTAHRGDELVVIDMMAALARQHVPDLAHERLGLGHDVEADHARLKIRIRCVAGQITAMVTGDQLLDLVDALATARLEPRGL